MLGLGAKIVSRSIAMRVSHRVPVNMNASIETTSYNLIRYSKFSSEAPNGTTPSDSSTEGSQASEQQTAASSVSPEQELINKLQIEIKDLKDQVLRSYAEEENVRRIAKRDVEQAKIYANSSFAKSMLEVADTLQMAIDVDTNKLAPDVALNVLRDGIISTEKNLQKVFHKFGVSKYAKVGDVFDPKLHDALYQMNDNTKPAGTIGQIVKSGYKIHDRVLRAAEVGTVTDSSN